MAARHPLTRPFSMPWRTTSSNIRRKTLRKRLATTQLRDGAVVRYPVKQISRYHRRATSVWIRCPICRSDGIPYMYPTSRYFTNTTGSIARRPCLLLYKWAVSSWTKDRSSVSSSRRKKCSCGAKSSKVTMCNFSYIPSPPYISILS